MLFAAASWSLWAKSGIWEMPGVNADTSIVRYLNGRECKVYSRQWVNAGIVSYIDSPSGTAITVALPAGNDLGLVHIAEGSVATKLIVE